VGGGAIMAPFLMAFFGLPIYTITRATLLGACLTSIAGVVFYTIIAPFYAYTDLAIKPGWMLGALFGAGGFVGMYCGPRLQKYMPARIIKMTPSFVIILLACRYIINIFSLFPQHILW
jgi:uncharacterized membrane protein YfcA